MFRKLNILYLIESKSTQEQELTGAGARQGRSTSYEQLISAEDRQSRRTSEQEFIGAGAAQSMRDSYCEKHILCKSISQQEASEQANIRADKHQSRQTLEQENVKEDMKEYAEAGARGERAFHVKKYSPCRSTRNALTHTSTDEYQSVSKYILSRSTTQQERTRAAHQSRSIMHEHILCIRISVQEHIRAGHARVGAHTNKKHLLQSIRV